MSCSCSSCARRRDESPCGKGAYFSRTRSLFYPRSIHVTSSTSASSHDPPFLFDGPSEIFTSRLRSRSRHPPMCSLRFTSRSATSNEPKYARIPSRRPGNGTRDEARARKPARVREARGRRFSLFVSFRLFQTRGDEKPKARLDGPVVARGDARAPKRERARSSRTGTTRARHSRLLDHASRLPDRSPPTESRPNATTRRNLADDSNTV